LPSVASKLPPNLTPEFLNQVYKEKPVPIRGGVSLEGQAQQGPDFSDPRQAFALTQIARGKVLDVCFPSKQFKKIDPAENVSRDFPRLALYMDRQMTLYLSP
jgi:hypothetical protein